jgi:hypothetical protein
LEEERYRGRESPEWNPSAGVHLQVRKCFGGQDYPTQWIELIEISSLNIILYKSLGSGGKIYEFQFLFSFSLPRLLFFLNFIYLVILEFELRGSCLLGRCFTT